jgi:hypothetical protein
MIDKWPFCCRTAICFNYEGKISLYLKGPLTLLGHTMKNTVTSDFTMDPGLLISVIKSQAGTLSKALLEGVMNSIDAGASSVHLTINETQFTIEDDGNGFGTPEQIRQWFGRFGTPHNEGDSTYGKFRMGRGQMMSFAATRWLSNGHCMDVDIEKRGLTYDLSQTEKSTRGCRIDGVLYAPLAHYELKDVLTELKKFVLYAPKPIYVNGELYGSCPSLLKSWTFENRDAYFKVVQDCEDLDIYNQGVFVQTIGAWRMGMGGVIVSKKPLEVNFARNSILENKCTTWQDILKKTEELVIKKLGSAMKLEDGERKYLARRALSATGKLAEILVKAKILTDPSGKHSTLASLKHYDKFVYIADSGALACAVHGTDKTFVVTDKLLTRFGCHSIEDFLYDLKKRGGLLQDEISILQPETVSRLGLGGAKTLQMDGLTPRVRASFATLEWLNSEIAFRLSVAGYPARVRSLLLGTHKRNTFIAWTDGKTYITVNKYFLKKLDSGLDGALFWAHTLIHEYMHDTDDSESHSHGEVFYQKFHDAIGNDELLTLGALAQATVVRYLQNM